MAQVQTGKITASDLLTMPHGNGERYELIEGELNVTAAAGGKHGLVIGKFFVELGVYLKENPIGQLVASETGFYTRGDDRTVRAPDLALIRDSAFPSWELEDGYLRIVPDLVLEVVSPNDRANDVDEKVQEWLSFGVKEVWVAYPSSQRIMIYVKGSANAVILNAGDMLSGRDILPGFERSVRLFFV